MAARDRKPSSARSARLSRSRALARGADGNAAALASMRRQYQRDMRAVMGRVVSDDEPEPPGFAAAFDDALEGVVTQRLVDLWAALGPYRWRWNADERRERLSLLRALGRPESLPVVLRLGDGEVYLGDAAKLLPTGAPSPVFWDDLRALAAVPLAGPLPDWLADLVRAVASSSAAAGGIFDVGGPESGRPV